MMNFKNEQTMKKFIIPPSLFIIRVSHTRISEGQTAVIAYPSEFSGGKSTTVH